VSRIACRSPGAALSTRGEAVICAVPAGSWGARRPSMADYVTLTGAASALIEIDQAVRVRRDEVFELRVGARAEVLCWGAMPSGMLYGIPCSCAGSANSTRALPRASEPNGPSHSGAPSRHCVTALERTDLNTVPPDCLNHEQIIGTGDLDAQSEWGEGRWIKAKDPF
jgi:hypothetical protein